MKLRNARERFRKVVQKEEEALFSEVDAIYTDGKKDATNVLTSIEVDGVTKHYKSKILEEHYIVARGPGKFTARSRF